MSARTRMVTMVDGYGRKHRVSLANYITIWRTVKHMAAIDPTLRVDGMTAGRWLLLLRSGIHDRINDGIPWSQRGLVRLVERYKPVSELQRGDTIFMFGRTIDVSRVRCEPNRGIYVTERRQHGSWVKLPENCAVLWVGSWDTSTGVQTLVYEPKERSHAE